MKTQLLCAVCSVLLLACGESGQNDKIPQQVSPQNASVTMPQQTGSPPLKIKGLYIGMDIQAVPSAMMNILAEQQLADFSFTDPIPVGEGRQCVLMYTKPFLHAIEARMRERYGAARAQAKINEEIVTSCVNSDGVMAVTSDAQNRVGRIEFNDTKDIFDTAGMSPADFVGKLSSEYHIPEMKQNEEGTSWSYAGADGITVSVNAREVLGIPMIRLSMNRKAQ